jgi:hypothetical protein
LHPDVAVEKRGSWWVLNNGGDQVFLKLLEGHLEPIKGSTDPILGWFSSRYGKKTPTVALTISMTGYASEVVFTTAIFTRSPF